MKTRSGCSLSVLLAAAELFAGAGNGRRDAISTRATILAWAIAYGTRSSMPGNNIAIHIQGSELWSSSREHSRVAR